MRSLTLAAACALAIALAGCATRTSSADAGVQRTRAVVAAYVHRVEPLRRAVNQLLAFADPILHTDARPVQARRMGRLERRFADYALEVAAIRPALAPLRGLQAEYARTYVLEDAYLSALAAGLADGDLDHLPNTQSAQRAAIIDWRIGLTLLARRSGVGLPADLQQAGRGEIAPAPGGS